MTARRAVHDEKGFTLVELVTILVLVGVLAVVALPRMSDMGVFKEKGFAGEVIAAFRYARGTALASGAAVRVVTSAGNGVTVRLESGGALSHPVFGGAYQLDVPSGVALNDTLVVFDALGRGLDGAGFPGDVSVRVGGREILAVIGETGCLITP